ncbi:hypothetical protein BABINDRAFT_160736 [Babjeviella inositovora NRRL Y-12698]|uniref:TAP42-like protein n=1 Tax=Babjeviella inositovora NRRL Y-12698 TaxID=984486 RepID=A0A1E3QWM3_9ASCO|nr:uncharacterized protein BABINDRAFT_160736 [Babjeviella inositovora NRRL Y-12698]ODQ81397.1 hypothetical protein BABINDRAFT_160736 [Babjeviella inositovora NRRL Y-12698]
MSDQPQSLSQRYTSAIASFTALSSLPLRQDSSEFQKAAVSAIEQFQTVTQSIAQLSLFSANEFMEDLNTNEIKYLGVKYYLGELHERVSSPRLEALTQAQQLYLQFIYQLHDYGLLSATQAKLVDGIASQWSPKLDEIMPMSSAGDAALRRATKIANYKHESTLTKQLELLELYIARGELDNLDDEAVRDLYFDQIKLFAVRAFRNLENLMMELEVLKHAPKLTEVIEPTVDDRTDNDTSSRFDRGFTDKLEAVPTDKPKLLSSTGKILRPFTITSDKRLQLRLQVFGTGQVLPSMSVEEYLDYELANGKMAAPAAPEEDTDEDDEEAADRETYKKREWDEFTDNNRKGSGNTMNRG